jgi:two-component system, NarL family, nitrate/nitrite response regulator NarL
LIFNKLAYGIFNIPNLIITMSKKINVFLADDHNIFLESMSMLVGVIDNVELVGTAKNGEEVLNKIVDSEAEILICDYYMPTMDGIELAYKLSELVPNLKILMLTSREDAEGIRKAIQAGIKGFLSKKISKNELIKAITQVAEGHTYYSENILNILTSDASPIENSLPIINGSLTTREIEIIKLIAQEMTGTDVAEALNLSTHTIATHRKNIFQKLHINSTYALIKYAIEHRLI